MNENNINENSIVTGATNLHTPFDIVYRTDKDYVFNNCIAVFWSIKPIEERVYFKAEFYDQFTETEFNNVDCTNQTAYLIKATKENYLTIIEDIENSPFFER